MSKLTPSTDTAIEQKYDKKTLESKGKNKTALQKEIGWPAEPKRPIVCIPAGMTEELGGELLKEALEGILTLPVELLVLGKGSKDYGSMFTELSNENGHRIYIVPNNAQNISKMYAASDMALFLNDPSGMDELTQCFAYGVVPVSRDGKGIDDYNPVQETGNAFAFTDENKWSCFAALVRAVETYKFPYDWRTIQRHCMETK